MRTVSFPTQSFNPVVYREGMDSTQTEGTTEREEPQSATTGATPLVSQADHLSVHTPQQTPVVVELHREPGGAATEQGGENSDRSQVDRRAPLGQQSQEQAELEAEVAVQSPANGGVRGSLPAPSYAQEVCTVDNTPQYDLYAMTVGGHAHSA